MFGIEIEQCARCGGRLKVIASIEESEVIAHTLAHLEHPAEDEPLRSGFGPRAPPQSSLF